MKAQEAVSGRRQKGVKLFLDTDFKACLLAAAIAGVPLLPYVFSAGLPEGYGAYDTENHAYRLWFFKENLANGRIPLWTSDWFGGMPFMELYQPGAALAFFGSDSFSTPPPRSGWP